MRSLIVLTDVQFFVCASQDELCVGNWEDNINGVNMQSSC